MPLSLADQLAGCLLGQALGDALGFPVEGAPCDVCAAYVSEVLRPGQVQERGRPPYPFGQYTDDTQLAREFVRSYVACKGFDPADYAQRIAAIFAEHRIVGRGRSTEAAAQRLAAGVPWDQAGEPPPQAGNGSAMRAAPCGVLFQGDMKKLVRVASDQGRITHADPRSVAGAVAIARAAALAAGRDAMDADTVITDIAELTRPIDAGFAAALQQLAGWLERPPAEAAKEIRMAGSETPEASAGMGISPFVIPSVLWSLYSFLRTPDDYWEAVLTAIGVGGDVDTTAAMTGGIAGARLGPDQLPSVLLGRITDQGEWDAAALTALAREAAGIARATTGSRPA